VLAFGGITVGGTGKSSVARWFARALAVEGGRRTAVLLRGYGARGGPCGPELVPDYPALDLAARVARYGDDALAHRAALPRGAAVVVGADRAAAARAAFDGFGARVLLLDDGWEQRGIAWDRLYAVLDPACPAGNGALLPAGPLRRPPATLREADAICFVLEDGDDPIPAETRRFLERHAPGAPVHRFRRRLLGLSRPGVPACEPAAGAGGRAGLVTGVGAPGRAARFLQGQGVGIAGHAVFPNHADWSADALRRAVDALRRAGAEWIAITEKDEPRWPRGIEGAPPVRVLRTALEPLPSDPDPLEPVRALLARGGLADRGGVR
jgi:tetraacyldisaccharide 4'-kinase